MEDKQFILLKFLTLSYKIKNSLEMSTTKDKNLEETTTETNQEISPEFEKNDIEIHNQTSDNQDTESNPDQKEQNSSEDEEKKQNEITEEETPETPTKEENRREDTFADPLEKKPYKLFLGGLPGHTNKGKEHGCNFFRSFDQLFRAVWENSGGQCGVRFQL